MNKIINSHYIKSVWVLFFLITPFNNYAQDTTYNKYGLWVVNGYRRYTSIVRKDADKEMVDLTKAVPGLVFDLKYAGTDNFMKTKLYPSLNTTFLRKRAANALATVQRELTKQGLRLKIFDAYRGVYPPDKGFENRKAWR